MKTQDIEKHEQIAKYLANSSNADEQETLRKWAGQSRKNKQQLAEAILLWNMMDQHQQHENNYDADLAWEKVKNGIKHHQRQRKTNVKRLAIYSSVAALLLLGLFALYNIINSPTHVQVANTGQVKTLSLQDGSVISLNAGSSITYPENFDNKETRTVQLTGEAYFEVEKKPDKPFVVVTDETKIRVLGTAFNVNAYDNNQMEVTVASGKISVSRNNKNALTVLPDELAVITNKQVVKKPNTNANYLAWKTKKFTFKDTELQEVAKHIERVYHCNIYFSDYTLKQCRLTAVFDNEEIDDIIQTICLAFNVQAKHEDNQYILSGRGCE